eukprot:scaffold165147_cov20-Tisochrysis_lutea.AAC.1
MVCGLKCRVAPGRQAVHGHKCCVVRRPAWSMGAVLLVFYSWENFASALCQGRLGHRFEAQYGHWCQWRAAVNLAGSASGPKTCLSELE